jgi:hypothetical protein
MAIFRSISVNSRFQRSDEITERVSAILALFDDLKRGDTILWTQIEAATGFSKDTYVTRYALYRARKELMENDPRGYVILPNNVDGFYIPTTRQQLTFVPKLRSRKARRQWLRSFKEVKATPDEGLTDFERQKKHFEMNRAQEMQEAMSRSDRESAKLTSATETLPKRPRTPVGTE